MADADIAPEYDVSDSTAKPCAVGRKPQRMGGQYGPPIPEVSRFYGIVVTLNYDDHAPPHFHARYGDSRATIGFDGSLVAGSLPARALGLVRNWAAAHAAELLEDWDRARAQLPLVPIAPLD